MLGRSKDSDIQVEDANVSRRHAELRREGDAWWLVDLGSTNGTELNGKRVQRSKLERRRHDHARQHRPPLRRRTRKADVDVDEALLVLQDRFIVLPLPLHLADRAQRSSDRTGPVPGSMIIAPEVRASSAAKNGDRPRTSSIRARKFRSTPCPSRSAAAVRTRSRSRATSSPPRSTRRFESKRDGLWVEDVGSTNGTFVNGARVTTPRRLAKGDVVRVGQTDFRVEV